MLPNRRLCTPRAKAAGPPASLRGGRQRSCGASTNGSGSVISAFALALGAGKNQVKTIAPNAGVCLASSIVDDDKEREIAGRSGLSCSALGNSDDFLRAFSGRSRFAVNPSDAHGGGARASWLRFLRSTSRRGLVRGRPFSPRFIPRRSWHPGASPESSKSRHPAPPPNATIGQELFHSRGTSS